MNDTKFQIVARLIAMGAVLAAIPDEDRDWAVWPLMGLIIFLELGVEPLSRFLACQFPNTFHMGEDPVETAHSIKTTTLFGEAVLAVIILSRVRDLI